MHIVPESSILLLWRRCIVARCLLVAPAVLCVMPGPRWPRTGLRCVARTITIVWRGHFECRHPGDERETGERRDVKSGQDGTYVVPLLPTGAYRI